MDVYETKALQIERGQFNVGEFNVQADRRCKLNEWAEMGSEWRVVQHPIHPILKQCKVAN